MRPFRCQDRMRSRWAGARAIMRAVVSTVGVMDKKLNDRLYAVRFTVQPALIDAVDERLAGLEVAATSWQAADDAALARYEIYTADPGAAESVVAAVAAALAQVGLASTAVTVECLANEDWAESWKRWFHAERVSPHIVIKPAWESWPEVPGEHVIAIDPGMSFGTGQHATTRACIVFLDRLASTGRGGALLDLGCGSGILAIAAAKLGYAPLLAIDIDPVATRDTRKNLVRNGIRPAPDAVRTGTVADVPEGARFAVVVANILAPVLIEHAAAIAACVAPGGHLVLSGILTTQFADVGRAYAPWATETERITLGEWTSGLFARPQAAGM
jgi:ribosomal protein L11 methyltransferase